MSLIKHIYPSSGNAFTRNPINVTVQSENLATYKVYVNNEVVFTGNGTGTFTVNISEILETAFAETEQVTGTNTVLQYPLGTNQVWATFEVSTSGEDTETVSFTAWKGGVNKTDFRALHDMETDIFNQKLLNYGGNFFFTTRTYGWQISIKETELEPLPFIMPTIPGEENGYITVRETVTGRRLRCSGSSGVLMALNIEQVRRTFFNDYGVLANMFEVMDPYHTNRAACRIVIERAETAQERCAVRFLNSFGVYERLDLVGHATIDTKPIENQEDTVFQKYDAVTDSFVRDRVRTEIGQTYSVETGAKRTDELNFIRDMLTSESVFLALEDREVKVIPSVETMGYRQRQTEPESFKITFTPVEDESNITALRTKYGSVKPRIFTSVFSEQFN